MNDIKASTLKIMKSCATAHLYEPTPENIGRAMASLIAWCSRGVTSPPVNGPESRELMHHVTVLSAGPSKDELSQALRFVGYLVETFGDPVEKLMSQE